MRCLIAYIAILLATHLTAYGQENIQIQAAYPESVAGAKFLPSTQTLPDHKFESSFLYNLWVANSMLTYGSIQKVLRQNTLTREEVNKIVDDLEPNNEIGVGTDFLILGLGLKTNIKNHPVVWGLTLSDRFNVRIVIPKVLVQLAWQGNKQFEGQTLDLSNTSITGLYFRECSFGLATQLASWGDWDFRGGIRLSYYMGLSAVNNSNNKFYFTSDVGVSKITMDYNFEYYYSGIKDFSFFDPRGHGFGINFGTSFTYKDRLHFDIGLTDLGYIKFSKKITKIGTGHQFEFEGLDLDEVINPTAFLDSLGNIFAPVTDSLSNNSFKMPVGTRLSFRTSLDLRRTKKFDRPVTLSFYYSQGFSDNPGITKHPYFALAYHRPVLKHFLFGVSASYGGINKWAMGGLIGMHWKHYRLSFQSDDFTGIILPNAGTGGGMGFMFQLLL